MSGGNLLFYIVSEILTNIKGKSQNELLTFHLSKQPKKAQEDLHETSTFYYTPLDFLYQRRLC